MNLAQISFGSFLWSQRAIELDSEALGGGNREAHSKSCMCLEKRRAAAKLIRTSDVFAKTR